jgi:hypothetical protein
MIIDITNKLIQGKGKNLYLVIRVDDQDTEHSSFDLILADSPAKLKRHVMIEYTNTADTRSDDYDEVGRQVFESEWESTLLWRKIGKNPTP